MRRVRADLVSHVGGNPCATQRMLIERAVMLSLKVALLDKKLTAGHDFTQIDSNTYLAWSNSLQRCLRDLGVQPAVAKPPSLADHLATLAARQGGAA
jgi:hypothetical protein